jgi:predicted Fe-Mo cluster-binding NifX family protein
VGIEAELDPHFGRAHAFLIVDPESEGVFHQITNDAADAAHGAGTGAAAIMSRNGVEAVISGRFGPKASQALVALGIEMWIAPAGIKAKEALKRLASGELEKMEITRFG